VTSVKVLTLGGLKEILLMMAFAKQKLLKTHNSAINNTPFKDCLMQGFITLIPMGSKLKAVFPY
jgi:hypothetical protein